MKIRSRTITIDALVIAALAGCSHSAPVASRPSAPEQADAQVCSHVSPAPYLWGPTGDWKTPAVAAVASGASPLVRDAYFTAASAPFPNSYNWSETFPPFQRAMSQLATVCAAVRARP